MDVNINQNRIDIPTGVTTWGDLLDWLETDYLAAGQCITRVYLGETESLNYREPDQCKQNIEAIGKIEVESGNFDTVVRESMAELTDELNRCLAATSEIVSLLENKQTQQAYTELGNLLESVRVFVAIFSEDLGWAEESDTEPSREKYCFALEQALTQLISAQENGYWVSVCDVLEYELTPILESWLKLVERTSERIN